MLSFTRRPNESFHIGEDIVVKVLGRDSNGDIEFGIEVPESVSVHGKEIESKLNLPAQD